MNALYLDTTGFENTANGAGALYFNTEGYRNTATGSRTLFWNDTGFGNTANGWAALYYNTIGFDNVANGVAALYNNIAGYHNTANGDTALFNNTFGSNNTAIGFKADVASGNLTNATAIGANAQAGANNSLVLGSINGVNGATATVNVGIGTTIPDASAVLDVTSTTQGFLPPRMTAAQRNAIVSPAEGLVLFNTTTECLEIYYGAWQSLGCTFSCGNNFLDVRNGQSYPTVKIGTQCWMSQNLNIGARVNGSADQTDNSIIEKYCYNDDPANCTTYGGLYQWAEAVQYLNGATNTTSWNPVPTGNVQGICPTGWHLPTDDEWTTLVNSLGGDAVAGGHLKEAETTHWSSPNIEADNSSGFSALPGGWRYFNGSFYYIGIYGYWWSASEYDTSYAWNRNLSYYNSDVNRHSINKEYGFSVRCVRD